MLVLGDINVEPDASPVLSHAIAKGILVDLGFNTGPTFFPRMVKHAAWMLH